MPIPTPHINAKKEDFAKTVLMPGDPLRAKFIVDNYLTNAVLVNNVRGIQGYTGEYKGKRVSVMASGMGMPSIGIYSYELFNHYDVQNIIRVGSGGMLSPKLHLRSVVAGMSAYSNSNYGAQYGFKGNLAPCCSFELLEKAGLTTPEETEIICSAIWHHPDKDVVDSPMDEVLKDADVLHHTLDDPTGGALKHERERYENLCREFGLGE